ncbi:hypothetical protein M5689_020621 [Euphorbia peplus]|nr:hypothetical protein M5689_020621 [Euphorbia peplus]
MERKTLSNVIVYCLVIVLLAGQSSAFLKRYRRCLDECQARCEAKDAPFCNHGCVFKCIHLSQTNNIQNTHQFCTTDCVTSLCSNLISGLDNRLDEREGLTKTLHEVEWCMDGCSKSCTNNYLPIPN